MKKLLLILIPFLVSCEWDYIHYNPKHPEEYVGTWNCDSIGINNKYHKPTMTNPYFGIYQEDLEFMNEALNRQVEYQMWEVKSEKLLGMNVLDVPIITFDIIKAPSMGRMELRLDSAVYFLTKSR